MNSAATVLFALLLSLPSSLSTRFAQAGSVPPPAVDAQALPSAGSCECVPFLADAPAIALVKHSDQGPEVLNLFRYRECHAPNVCYGICLEVLHRMRDEGVCAR